MPKSFCILCFLFFIPSTLVGQSAKPEDVVSIEAIITAVYASISGDAGVARDWERFRSLFTESATLSPVILNEEGNFERIVMTPESYIERSGRNLERNGFHEVEISRVTEEFGQIAHSFTTYESRRKTTDPEPFARGINSFQLMHDGDRWWIVSIYWQGEGESNPIPAKYLN
ncbi:MAG: hypothetical protein GKR91_08390 [Pseudomonadales bacterium]|nr:hypothetical protein [Pseudomonadales bacterium]